MKSVGRGCSSARVRLGGPECLRRGGAEDNDTGDFFDAAAPFARPVRSLARMASARPRLRTSTVDQVRISGRGALWKLDGLAMSRTSLPPVSVARRKSNLRRDPIDHWVISYCVRGTHFMNTAGTAVEVPAKVPFLSSLGQEFLHERKHIDRVSFLMARDAFRGRSPRSPRICVLQTPPASAVPSNVSLATARASYGRRHSPGWRHRDDAKPIAIGKRRLRRAYSRILSA